MELMKGLAYNTVNPAFNVHNQLTID